MSRVFVKHVGGHVYVFERAPGGAVEDWTDRQVLKMTPAEARDLVPELESATVDALGVQIAELERQEAEAARQAAAAQERLERLRANLADLKERLR